MAGQWHSALGSQCALLLLRVLLRLLPSLPTFSHTVLFPRTARRYMFNLVAVDMRKRAASTFAENSSDLAKLELVAAEWDTKRGATTLPKYIKQLRGADQDTKRRKVTGPRKKKAKPPPPREHINVALLPPSLLPAATSSTAAASSAAAAAASASSASSASASSRGPLSRFPTTWT